MQERYPDPPEGRVGDCHGTMLSWEPGLKRSGPDPALLPASSVALHTSPRLRPPCSSLRCRSPTHASCVISVCTRPSVRVRTRVGDVILRLAGFALLWGCSGEQPAGRASVGADRLVGVQPSTPTALTYGPQALPRGPLSLTVLHRPEAPSPP